jgi:cell division protein FtsQ
MKAKRKTRRNMPARGRRLAGLSLGFKIVLPVFIVAAAAAGLLYLLIPPFKATFSLHKIVFSGNTHLTDEELKGLSGLKGGEDMITLSASRVSEKITSSPWVREATVRKELPDTVRAVIQEAEPFALLDMTGRMFLVDDEGELLEELRETAVPFLPVIAGNPFEQKSVYSEAIRLVQAMKQSGLLLTKDHIEVIAHDMRELSVNIDGTVVKVGQGDYEEKLTRLAELEGDIRKRQIPVDYIDLRFANRVIVKPVNEVVR